MTKTIEKSKSGNWRAVAAGLLSRNNACSGGITIPRKRTINQQRLHREGREQGIVAAKRLVDARSFACNGQPARQSRVAGIAVRLISFLIVTTFICGANTNLFADYLGTNPTQIVRSVGPSATTALEVGTSNNLTISGSIASFASALGDNIGVGDAIQYDSDNNGSIDAIAFIHSRTDSTHYILRNAAGAAVPDMAVADNDWSIFRAYISLGDAESGGENIGIESSLRNFDTWSGGKDLTLATGSNEQWNIACYANGTTSDSRLTIEGWTTSADNHIKIFTPVGSDEVGISQRHDGKWNQEKYKLEAASEHIMLVREDYIKIDGIQIKVGASGYGIVTDSIGVSNELSVSNSIIRSEGSSGRGISVYSPTIAKVWNCIIYGFITNAGTGLKTELGATMDVYNCTVSNNARGVWNQGTMTVINTVSFNNSAAGYDFRDCDSVTYSASDDAKSGTGNIDWDNEATDWANAFVDYVNGDFHLKPTNMDLKDGGTDLSGEGFSDDIDGDARPGFGSAIWDIGADEEETPPYRSNGSPTGRFPAGTTGTDISLTTDENATCKYSTIAGTA